jgi:hypothetical protein
MDDPVPFRLHFMVSARIRTANPATKRLPFYALDRTATAIGPLQLLTEPVTKIRLHMLAT